MAGPHVTGAVGLKTATGTAQPLTCGRPRQTGRRSAMSGIGSVSAGFAGTNALAEPTRAIDGAGEVPNYCDFVRASSTSYGTSASGWRIRADQIV